MIAAGGAFSMLNFQPAMLLFANGAVVLTEKLLIPLIDCSDCCSIWFRDFIPAVPFTKMADLFRTIPYWQLFLLSVAAYSIFITVGGTLSWALSGVTSEPIKELSDKIFLLLVHS